MEAQSYSVDPNLFENTFNYTITRFPKRQAPTAESKSLAKPFELSELIKK
jgi:hypothetical protein